MPQWSPNFYGKWCGNRCVMTSLPPAPHLSNRESHHRGSLFFYFYLGRLRWVIIWYYYCTYMASLICAPPLLFSFAFSYLKLFSFVVSPKSCFFHFCCSTIFSSSSPLQNFLISPPFITILTLPIFKPLFQVTLSFRGPPSDCSFHLTAFSLRKRKTAVLSKCHCLFYWQCFGHGPLPDWLMEAEVQCTVAPAYDVKGSCSSPLWKSWRGIPNCCWHPTTVACHKVSNPIVAIMLMFLYYWSLNL